MSRVNILPDSVKLLSLYTLPPGTSTSNLQIKLIEIILYNHNKTNKRSLFLISRGTYNISYLGVDKQVNRLRYSGSNCYHSS